MTEKQTQKRAAISYTFERKIQTKLTLTSIKKLTRTDALTIISEVEESDIPRPLLVALVRQSCNAKK